MNVAEKMRELLPILRAGVNGIGCPEVRPECEDQWSENYAIVQTFYWDTPLDNDYFDEPRFRFDTENVIREHFTEAGRKTVLITEPPSPEFLLSLGTGTVVVRIMYRSQEIEVYVVDAKEKEKGT